MKEPNSGWRCRECDGWCSYIGSTAGEVRDLYPNDHRYRELLTPAAPDYWPVAECDSCTRASEASPGFAGTLFWKGELDVR
jgi:hypothetical protein